MPENGLGWRADKRRWKFSLDGTGSHTGLGTGSYSASALAAVFFTPDTINEAAFFALAMSIDIDAGTSSVTYVGPGAPLGVTYTSGVALVVEIVLEGDDVYNIGGNWYQNGTLKLYVGGVLKITASVAGTVSGGLGPHYLMYGGEEVWASLSPPSAGTTGLPGPMPDTFAYASSADATLTVWCEWQEPGSGVWTGSPVSFHSSDAPAVPGSCTDPGVGTVSGSSTTAFVLGTHAEQSAERVESDSGTVTLVCTHVYCDGVEEPGSPFCASQPGGGVDWTRWKNTDESKSTSVSVGLVADRDKSVGRIAPGTKFGMYRTEMPETKYAGSASCTDNGVTTTTTTGGTVHPHQAEILQIVTDSLAAMEDTFGYRSYSERQASGGWAKTITYEDDLSGLLYPSVTPCTDPDAVQTQVDVLTGYTDPPDNESYSSSRSYTFPSYVGPSSDMAGYLGHALDRPRYINSWCNPHWSFFLWFEPWEVDGSPEGIEEYWLQLRQQHLDNAALPSPPKTRNHVVSDGLANDQGMRAFFDTFTGGLPWVGISRWQTKAVTPLQDYTYGTGSVSLWSVDDGTLSVDATGATSTPAGSFAGNPEFTMALSSWTVEPFLWPALADAGIFDWVTGNISAGSVKLRGRNGEEVAWPCTRGVQSSWPKGQPSKYCGSWAQDYGADGVVDQGADQDAGGDSAAVYADPALCTASQGLADFTAKELVFVVTPVDPSQPVTVKWPRLKYTKSASRVVLVESAQDQVVVHPDGPAVRVGDLAWYDSFLGWINPPLVEPGTSKVTAVDGLEYDRLLLRGVAYNGGSPDLTTELTQRWDSFEVNSVGGVARNSVSFFFPATGVDWNMALVNTMSEFPPTGTIPVRKRDSSWQPTGAWAQESWIWAQDVSKIVAPARCRLTDPASVDVSSPGTGVSGWDVDDFTLALAETEAGYLVKRGSKSLGSCRPFRGYFVVPTDESRLPIAYDVSDDFSHFRLVAGSGGDVQFGRAPNAPIPLAFADVDAGQTWDWADVRFDRRSPGQEVWAVAESGGSVSLYRMLDGATFTLLASVGSGAKPALHFTPGRQAVVAYTDGGALKTKYYDPQGTLLASVTAVASGCDAEGCAVYSVVRDGGFDMVLLTVESGQVTRRVSTDGGGAWGSPTTVAAGKHPRGVCGPAGRPLEAWLDGTDIKGRRLDAQSNVTDAVAVWASSVDDQAFGLHESSGPNGQWRAVLLFASSGADAQLTTFEIPIWT